MNDTPSYCPSLKNSLKQWKPLVAIVGAERPRLQRLEIPVYPTDAELISEQQDVDPVSSPIYAKLVAMEAFWRRS